MSVSQSPGLFPPCHPRRSWISDQGLLLRKSKRRTTFSACSNLKEGRGRPVESRVREETCSSRDEEDAHKRQKQETKAHSSVWFKGDFVKSKRERETIDGAAFSPDPSPQVSLILSFDRLWVFSDVEVPLGHFKHTRCHPCWFFVQFGT